MATTATSAFDVIKSALRPRVWLMGISTVLFGSAAASLHGNFEPITCSLCLLFVVVAHMTASLLYRYSDEKFGFGENIDDNFQKYTDLGLSTEAVLKEGATAGMILTVMIGLAIGAMAGWILVVFGIAIIGLLALAYMGPSPLIRTPWSLVLTFFIFGPLGVIATCLVQSQHEAVGQIINWYDLGPAVYLSVVGGALGCNCHLILNYASFERDRENSKVSLTVKYGQAPTRWFFLFNTIVVLVMMVSIFVIYRPTEWGLCLYAPIACLPLYIYVWRRMTHVQDNAEWRKLKNITFYSMLLVAVVTQVIFALTGHDVPSRMQYFIEL